jgi:hypothetical protein
MTETEQTIAVLDAIRVALDNMLTALEHLQQIQIHQQEQINAIHQQIQSP